MTTDRAITVRVVLLVLLAVHMQVGPILHQVLGLPTPLTTMSWSMYSGAGLDHCAVAWTDGAGNPVRRPPGAVRFLATPDEVRAAAAGLCAAVPDLRAVARCPDARGRYQTAIDGPVCR
ncbi:MAG: hypothetical protein ABMB14_18780 [Myxococcota bacterium]